MGVHSPVFLRVDFLPRLAPYLLRNNTFTVASFCTADKEGASFVDSLVYTIEFES